MNNELDINHINNMVDSRSEMIKKFSDLINKDNKNNNIFRTLKASEIEVRINNFYKNNKGLAGTFLIYKNARVDISILNETYNRNWKRYHRVEGQYFICGVSVYNEDLKEWVNYEDTGEASYSHSDKGLFSDSFKRACVNLGIGIELYTAPSIKIELNTDDYYTKEKNKSYNDSQAYQLKTSFYVSEIEYDNNRNISKLIIKDDKHNERYRFEIPDYSIVSYGKNKGKKWESLSLELIVKGLNHHNKNNEYDFVNGILNSIKGLYIDAGTNLCSGDSILINKDNKYYACFIEDEIYTSDTKKHYFIINGKYVEAKDIYLLKTVLVLNTDDRQSRLNEKYNKRALALNKEGN